MNSRTMIRSIFLIGLAALFAGWAPVRADGSHARIIRLSLVQGDVRFARDVKGDPLTSDKAAWEGAILNLPIRQGYVLATDQGRAGVEFENGAMAFLGENTVLEFYDLSLEDGGKNTRLVLRQGTASFYVNPGSNDYFSVTGGDFTVEADGRAGFRLDNFDDGSAVNVTKGRVSVLRKEQTTALVKGQSMSMRAGDNASVSIGRLPESDDFDRWVAGREETVVTATAASQQYVNSPYYTSGFADLYTYGSWRPIGIYGNCWRPYGVGLGWSPFDNGGWFTDPVFGAAFIGSQPWGWLPYHYGGWVFDPVFGWLWAPGLGFGYGFNGFAPFRPVTGVFLRSKTGLLGLVPVHPLDARGKEPVNLARGIFPVSGGTVSRDISASNAESWKVMKAPPREAIRSNAVAASVAPARVSRTILADGSGGRVVTMDRNSSIAFDAKEHRFVNTNSPNAGARSAPAGSSGDAAEARVTGKAGAVVARGTTVVAPRPVAPASTTRAAMTPPRAMVPPAAPRSFERGGAERGAASRGGWASGGAASAAGSTHSGATHSAPASHPASSGRPH